MIPSRGTYPPRRQSGAGEANGNHSVDGQSWLRCWLARLLWAVISILIARLTLTDKDTIVLADFTNTTGDPVFDGTLRQGLSVQLEQSPFLSIISDQRIQQTLKLMGQKPDAKLTPEIARELCQRTGSAAVLTARLHRLARSTC